MSEDGRVAGESFARAFWDELRVGLRRCHASKGEVVDVVELC